MTSSPEPTPSAMSDIFMASRPFPTPIQYDEPFFSAKAVSKVSTSFQRMYHPDSKTLEIAESISSFKKAYCRLKSLNAMFVIGSIYD